MSIVIGLTGGIASGKSTVGRLLQQRGVPVIDCDVLGHRTYEAGSPVVEELAKAFGKEIVTEEGQINRKELGGKVFGKPEEMKKLTDIVWPGISALLKEELERLKHEPIVVVEAAVLFEAGWDKLVSQVWTVAVNEAEAIARLAKRNNLDEESARKRIASQWSNEQRRAKAHVEITNEGSIADLEEQVEKCLQAIKSNL